MYWVTEQIINTMTLGETECSLSEKETGEARESLQVLGQNKTYYYKFTILKTTKAPQHSLSYPSPFLLQGQWQSRFTQQQRKNTHHPQISKCHSFKKVLFEEMVNSNFRLENLTLAHQFSSVQFSRSVVSDSLQPHEQASLSHTNSRSPPKAMYIESVMSSNHLSLSSPSLPALNLSQHQGLF